MCEVESRVSEQFMQGSEPISTGFISRLVVTHTPNPFVRHSGTVFSVNVHLVWPLSVNGH